MAENVSSKGPADGDKLETPVSDWPIADLLEGYRGHMMNAHTIAGVLVSKHRFTKKQLPKPPKAPSSTLVSTELADKVKGAMKGRTVTANQLDEFLFANGIRPYSKTGIARKELKTIGVVEMKENAAGTATYLWLSGETMTAPTGADLALPQKG